MTPKNHRNISLALLGALLLLVPASSLSQSLGEVARQVRKEREAQEKEGKVPVKVFTNDDIARMPPAATSDSSQQKPSTPASPAPPGKPPESAKPPATANGETSAGPSAAQPGKTEDRMKSKEYWQARFKAARAVLAHAKDEQALVNDELQLLQIQQARELDPDASRKLNSQIDASTVEFETKRAATEKAQQALDEIEKEFKNSGAPQDWIQNKESPD